MSVSICLVKADLGVTGNIYSRISNLECLKHYSSPFGNRSDLIVVSSDNLETDNNLLHCGVQGIANLALEKWMCEHSNTFSCKKLAPHGYGNQAKEELAISHWNIADYAVEYCMVSYQPTEHLCRVVYSFRIMLGKRRCEALGLQTNHVPVVCLFNYLKCLCIIYTTVRYSRRSDPPISILGDALASFLKHPDNSTQGLAIISKQDFLDDPEMWRNPTPRQWHPRRLYWFSAASKRRWYSTLAL